MSILNAFIGHSFTGDDKDVVREFLEFFDHVKDLGIGFAWEHAEPAEPRILSKKVLEIMEEKNLFIAICTAKELAITPEKLKKTWWNKKLLLAKEDDFTSKTSDWIIQEIGVALGKSMDDIVLLEEGLRKPGGLQGDLEYISFNRSEPSKSFNKIIEMLNALTPKKTVGHMLPMETEEKKEDKVSSQQPEVSLEPDLNWKKEKYEFALYLSITKGNQEQEENIIKAYFESAEGKQDPNRESFKALKFHFRRQLGKGVYLEELRSLSKEYPDNDEIAIYLGEAYEEYEDFNKAADQYEKSAKHAQTDKARLFRLCKSAMARSKGGDADAEEWLLNQARELMVSVDDGEFEVLSTIKDINKIQNNDDKYLAYAETILNLRPDDHDLRFLLAFKYSELGNDELSLLHYLRIPSKERSSAVWNNIGVAHDRIGNGYKSVNAYRESETLGGTRAMSNLAHKLITAGFINEAEEICNRAVKIKDYDKQVGTAISSIEETKDGEEKKQKKILDGTEQRRKYYIEFGRACVKQPPSGFEGLWTAPECELNIKVRGRNFIAIGSYEKKQRLKVGPGLLYASPFIKQEEKTVKVNVRYEGFMSGLGIEFKLFIDKEGEQSTLLTAISTGKTSNEGLMIIAEDIKSIRVYEKRTKENEKYYEFSRK